MNNDDLIKKLLLRFPEEEKKIIEKLNSLDRAEFIPAMYRSHAYFDEPVPIGEFQISLKPSVMISILKLLRFESGQKVLEIGMGSGYFTALTWSLISPGGKLITIERVRRLCAFGQHNLKKYFEKDIKDENIRIIHEDGVKIIEQFPDNSFNRIYFNAEIRNRKKFGIDKFVRKLKMNGILLIPENKNKILVFTKSLRGKPFLLEEKSGFNFTELKTGKC